MLFSEYRGFATTATNNNNNNNHTVVEGIHPGHRNTATRAPEQEEKKGGGKSYCTSMKSAGPNSFCCPAAISLPILSKRGSIPSSQPFWVLACGKISGICLGTLPWNPARMPAEATSDCKRQSTCDPHGHDENHGTRRLWEGGRGGRGRRDRKGGGGGGRDARRRARHTACAWWGGIKLIKGV